MIFLLFSCQTEMLVEEKVYIEDPSTDDSGAGVEEINVSFDDAKSHLEALQLIADSNNGNRAVGTSGYDASVEYVAEKLSSAGLEVEVLEFSLSFFRVLGDPQLIVDGEQITELSTFEYSPSGEVQALAAAVDVLIPPGTNANTSTSGCEFADFDSFPAGRIAIIQRGTCTFAVKVQNAQMAGAVAVVIFNEGQADRQDVVGGTLGPEQFDIPVLGTSYGRGVELIEMAAQGKSFFLSADTEMSEVESKSLLATLNGGDPSQKVILGAHLDSVPAGPGINDNGSGVASVLAVAESLAAQEFVSNNQLQFAFWGAEEVGLVGSYKFIDSLTSSELASIAAYLNFDMVASPNFIRFIYDGDGSYYGESGPNGSAEIENFFVSYFDDLNLQTEPTAFDGRSDYGPFIAVGVPAGGLFSGAEQSKTPGEANIYGGDANSPYDACYHESCDTDTNINDIGFSQMLNAIEASAKWAADQQFGSRRATVSPSWKQKFSNFTYRGCKIQK